MSLYALDGVAPELPADGDFWVAPGARLSGRVVLEQGASVWFNAVLRGDNEPIVVGRGVERAGRLRLPHRHRLSADHRRRTAPSATWRSCTAARSATAAWSAWARRC